MLISEKLKNGLVNQFRVFCRHSTLHGFYYFYKSNSWWVYLIWGSIIVSNFGLCAFLGRMIWSKYVIDPTVTVVESTHYSTANIPFPAVALCDSNVVYGPSTVNITKILLLRGYGQHQIDEFYRSFEDVKSVRYKPLPYLRKMHTTLENLGYPIQTLLDMFRKPCEVLLVECIWRSKQRDCSTMFREIFTFNGYCCQFDISYFRRHVKDESQLVAGVESPEALEVILNGLKVSVDGTASSDGHVLVYVFDEDDAVTILDTYEIITPATYFETDVYVWAIQSTDDVNALPMKTRKCILQTEESPSTMNLAPVDPLRHSLTNNIKLVEEKDLSDRWLKTKEIAARAVLSKTIVLTILHDHLHMNKDTVINGGYYQGCMMILILRKVVNSCRCLPFKMLPQDLQVPNYEPCMWDRYVCIYQNIDKVLANIRDIISLNECFQRCDHVQYETRAQFLQQQRLMTIWNLSYSKLDVHFAENTCLKYRRDILYTWDQMLANLGGIFGLCLGGSIISLIELVWFIIEVLCTIVSNNRKNKSIEKKEKDRVFIISRNEMVRKKSNKRKVEHYSFRN